MSLMAAGVPLKAMVAGISCGLVTGDTDDDYPVSYTHLDVYKRQLQSHLQCN